MTMKRVHTWLESLELSQYVDAFEQNAITFDLLPDLDNEVLRDIGVSAAGHRMQILKAVRVLKGQAPAEIVTPAISSAPEPSVVGERPASTQSPSAPREAERRHITVMFCDLVGSTALSQTLDPEDLRDLMRSYQNAARQVIERYEGHVAQYLGDGIMVYFGWPRAHGDEARRAVLSGLEIIEAVGLLEAPAKLAVRVGIATGVVVIGDTGEGDAAEPKTAVGETPNIAARLQGLARPNAVVIGPVTKTLAREAFDYEDLGSQVLKGISEPVHAWKVLGIRAEETEHHWEAGQRDRLLVGRDEEIGLLRRAWQQSKSGHGQVVLVNGEPGIGKSALVDTLLAQLREEGVPRITIRCSDYHTNTALYPVIEHVKKVIGWQAEDVPNLNLDRLEHRLKEDRMPLEELVPPFASLLSLPLPEGRYPPLNLSAQDLKQRILDDLAEWQFEIAQRQPTVMVWEDLHWADPSSLEYLSLLIEQVPTASLLLVLTFRPDFAPAWNMRSHMTPITLNRLEPLQIEGMVKNLANGKPLPEEVLDHIVRKTDGVPLYVEELTKTILDSKVLRETPARYELTGPLSAVAIPATLQESLMARLDRLPFVRQVAQLGAVLGREFAYEMLRALGIGDEPTLKEGLSQLVADELLHQRGRPPRAKYTFKHALIQDAAYQSLLKRTRQQYHRQVAQLLEARFPEQVETQPELLAYHYAGAGMAAEAIEYWRKAATRAVGRSAYREAFAHLDAATELLEDFSPGRERTRVELQLQLQRAAALLATKGMSAAETGEAYSAARELCRHLGEDVREILPALWGIFLFHNVRSEYHLSLEVAQDALQRAQQLEDPALIVLAHRMMGPPLVQRGELQVASEHLEQVRRLYDPVRDRDSAQRHGTDLKVGGLAFLAQAALLRGYPDRALALAREALSHAQGLEHAYSVGYAQQWVAVIHFLRREPESSAQQAKSAMTLSEQHGFAQWSAYAKAHLGRSLIELGKIEEGASLIRVGLSDGMGIGIGFNRTLNLASLAVGAAKVADWNEVMQQLDDALRQVDASGERWYEAEIHRLKGEFLVAQHGAAAAPRAELCFQQSIEIARHQGAKAWELRAATSLAQLWHSQGKRKEARDPLLSIYSWFTEGFDTKDLMEAKVLLEQLSAGASPALPEGRS
jgi:class 3 adenylate cyclase